MGLTVGKVIIMGFFSSEGMKAVIADIGFTIVFRSVSYESRHVSDPSVMFLLGFGVFEEEEVYVVLALFVGGEVFDGKGEFRVSRIDGVQIY